MTIKLPRALTWRVALGFALLTALLIGTSGVYLYHALRQEMSQRDREELAGKIVLFQKTVSLLPRPAVLGSEPGILTHYLVGHEYLALKVRAASGQPLLSSHQSIPEVPYRGLPHGAVPLSGVGADGQTWQGLAASAQTFDGQTVELEVWRNTDAQEALLRWYRSRILGAGLLATLVAAALGWLLVRRSLTPLAELTASAQHIHHHTLNRRLDGSRVPTELRGIVASFNGILERLDHAFAQLSSYASDLAHEMRTPLGILLGQTQVALSKTRTAEQYRQVLSDNAEEIERLSRMVNDLLFLAKAEHTQILLTRVPLDLESEAQRVCDFFELLAEERGVQLVVKGHLRLAADREALRRLLNNLVSNAIRYSPPGETVYLAMAPELPGFIIDNRSATPLPDDLSTLFDRFYSRGEKGDGHGLGLPIAAAIARLHGGEIRAERRAERLAMTVRFHPSFRISR